MPPREQRGRLGRRLVIGIYVIALSYLVIVGFASVIPQVFWPESDDSFDVDCADGLRILYDELDAVRLEYLSSNVSNPAALREKLESWDLRLNALRNRCDEDKVHLLNKYRHRVELNLQRYMREDAPLANRVAETLGSTPDQTPTNPTEPAP
ncbi:MAG: hypothetical protein O7F08_07030 [Deltaproteobacteria bacterium]|nr:hypothetical protein [Deltaproteobacteria bacterium]